MGLGVLKNMYLQVNCKHLAYDDHMLHSLVNASKGNTHRYREMDAAILYRIRNSKKITQGQLLLLHIFCKMNISVAYHHS